MNRDRILIVDDDLTVLKFLQAAFKDTEYGTLTATNGLQAIETVEKEMPDLVILDIAMPKMDGLQVCRRLREWSQIPIIMLSAFCDTEEKVKCLEAGADDFVCKPFSMEELIARIISVLRRSKAAQTPPAQPVMTAGDLYIDFNARRVTSSGNDVKLTPTEYSLLRELAANVGKVLDHTYLLKKVWGAEYSGEMEYLRVFVNRLRAKLEPDQSKPRYIITIPGVGYMFNRRAPDRV
jgi:two-component system KDP operon response regulator KdpE